MQTKILLVDDHPVFRAGLRGLLDTVDEIDVIGEACDGIEAIQQVKEKMPDVLVMDITMPNLNGIEATKEILSFAPDVKVLALSIHSGKHFVRDMIDAGAMGYLLKDSAPDELLLAVEKLVKGEMYLSSAITKVVLGIDKPDEVTIRKDILFTKLHRPPVTADYVIRTSIIDQLEQNIDKPLSLITAPAGYGKSVTICQWLDKTKVLHSWISLDEELDNLRSFLLYIQAAVEKIFPGSLKKTSALLGAAEMPAFQVMAHSLINELDRIEQDFILVLDDYHLIRNEAIHKLIDEILHFPPEHMHLVILSRRDPALNLNILRSHNRLNEMRMQELSFTKEEITALFEKLHDVIIKEKTADSLHEKTEGWIVGLRLASLSLGKFDNIDLVLENIKGDIFSISEYLVEEVLLKQPEQVQELLLSTSLLDRFCAELIDELNAINDNEAGGFTKGEDFLDWLVKSNLFVFPLDSQHKWFRFHHLFRDLLKHKFDKKISADDAATLHLQIGNWFSGQGLIDESLHHFLAAGNYTTAAELIEKHAHAEYLHGVFRVGNWMNKIPLEVRHQRQAMVLLEAWHAFGQFHLEKIPPLLEKLEATLAGGTLEPNLLAEVSFFQGNFQYWMGDTKGSIKTMESALNLVDDLPVHVLCNIELILHMALQRSGKSHILIKELQHKIKTMEKSQGYHIAYTYGSLTFVHLLDGNLYQANEVSRQWEVHSSKINASYLLNWSCYMQASANLQMFNLDDALHHFKEVSEKSFNLDLRAILDSMSAIALIYHLKGDNIRAARVIDNLLHYAENLNDHQSFVVAKSAQAHIALLQGEIDLASQWADSFTEKVLFAGIFFWIEVPWITQAKIFIALGTPEYFDKAICLLEELLQLATLSNLNFVLVELNLLLSIAHNKKDEAEQAGVFLEKALVLAESQGCVRPFIEAGQAANEMLTELEGSGKSREYAERLINIFSSEIDARQINALQQKHGESKELTSITMFDEAVKLSRREIEVLNLLAQGLRNKEIADQLFVSNGTIKKHVYNIGQKLDTHTRIGLLNKAKAMGFIEEG